MKVVINPKYERLADVIHGLPGRKFTGDEVVREKRNSIYKIEDGGQTFIVKKYKKPTLINQFVYAYLRKSKAKRAYEFAFRLEELGIGTAEPVAYIEIKRHGLLHTGYFVSDYLPHRSLEEIHHASMEEGNPAAREQYHAILKDFVPFTVDLHEKGVMHHDYNLSNVLYYKDGGGYRFAMIDINQMRFGKMSTADCLHMINKMGFQLPTLVWVVEQYAIMRGKSPLKLCSSILSRRRVRTMRRQTKRTLQAKVFYPLRDALKSKK